MNVELRLSNACNMLFVNAMDKRTTYITEEGMETLKRIKMRHEHEQGRRLRDLCDVSKVDDSMEKISHMMIQADEPIASRRAKLLQKEGLYEVETIVSSRLRKGKREYLIKWKGYGEEENTYEPSKNVPRELIDEFRMRQREKSR